MKEFKKWLEKEGEETIDNYQNHYSSIEEFMEDTWKAALKCVKNEMLSNCYEPMDIYDFIEEELAC